MFPRRASGLRLGYLVAPRRLYPKLLQAKQASDLHTPGFNQRGVGLAAMPRTQFDEHLQASRIRWLPA